MLITTSLSPNKSIKIIRRTWLYRCQKQLKSIIFACATIYWTPSLIFQVLHKLQRWHLSGLSLGLPKHIRYAKNQLYGLFLGIFVLATGRFWWIPILHVFVQDCLVSNGIIMVNYDSVPRSTNKLYQPLKRFIRFLNFLVNGFWDEFHYFATDVWKALLCAPFLPFSVKCTMNYQSSNRSNS